MTEKRERETKREIILEIGRLSYCSIFECFVELSFDADGKTFSTFSSGYNEQREYRADVVSRWKRVKK